MTKTDKPEKTAEQVIADEDKQLAESRLAAAEKVIAAAKTIKVYSCSYSVGRETGSTAVTVAAHSPQEASEILAKHFAEAKCTDYRADAPVQIANGLIDASTDTKTLNIPPTPVAPPPPPAHKEQQLKEARP
jgi:hypothetical protein